MIERIAVAPGDPLRGDPVLVAHRFEHPGKVIEVGAGVPVLFNRLRATARRLATRLYKFFVNETAEPDAALVNDPEAGIDFSRVVHADQRFTHHRPVVAGDELTAAVTVDNVRPLGSGAMVTSRVEITTVSGEKVATTVSSLLVRGEDQ